MKYVYPVIKKYKGNFEIVYKVNNSDTIVYKRLEKLN
ncbi:hypothetical protein ES703_13074 [subsurface metagenome]